MNILDLKPRASRRHHRANRPAQQRTPQFVREFTTGWNFSAKEAHHERGGEKENRGCAKGTMGEAKTSLVILFCSLTKKSTDSGNHCSATGTHDQKRTDENGYRLLNRSGLFVHVVPFAQSILSRLTSP
jgi:hypothetical protein